MAEQRNEHLIENHETYLVGSAPFPEVNAITFDLYFHDRDIDYGNFNIKEISKTYFVNRSGTIM